MHSGEPETSEALVRRLIEAQCPQWADARIDRVLPAGTDHTLYRLGADKVVRLPCTSSAALQVVKEQTWLPRLTPGLPLATPTVLVRGAATGFFPWPWSVYRWIEAEVAGRHRFADATRAARTIGEFINALQRIGISDAPAPGEHNAWRGVALAGRDRATRAAIAALGVQIDAGAALRSWEAALAVPAWQGPPVWIHGDLQPTNLLLRDGHLCAVIDFGLLGAGDPACDVMVAWTSLLAAARPCLRSTLNGDAATWARGRGWALSFALIALPYYRGRDPMLAGIAAETITEVLADS